jgi:hypothetical protein
MRCVKKRSALSIVAVGVVLGFETSYYPKGDRQNSAAALL